MMDREFAGEALEFENSAGKETRDEKPTLSRDEFRDGEPILSQDEFHHKGNEKAEPDKKKKKKKLLYLATSIAAVVVYTGEGNLFASPDTDNALAVVETVIEEQYSINGKNVPFAMPYTKDLIEVLETEDYMEAIFAAVDFYEKQGLPTYETSAEMWDTYMSRRGETYDRDFLEYQREGHGMEEDSLPTVTAFEYYVLQNDMAYDWYSTEHKPEGYRKTDTMFMTYQADRCADGFGSNEIVLYWSDVGNDTWKDWALSITILDFIYPSGELGSYHVTLVAGESDEQGMAVNPIYYEGEIDKSTGETYIYEVDASAMNGKDALEYEAVESIPYKRYHGYRGAMELESSGIGHHAIYWDVRQPGGTFEYIPWEEK